MKIYHTLNDFTPLNLGVVTLGTFDGVHVGHQKILARIAEIATQTGGESVVITFWPHPRMILHPDDTLKLLSTFEEKAMLLRESGIQHLLRIPFTKEFSQLSAGEFISTVLVNTIGTRKLVIGYDHHFGKNREGSLEQLILDGPKYGFEVEEISRQEIDSITVSSTKIRKALEEGEIPVATELLGRYYELTGRVVKGDRIGRLMGFPTANLELDAPYKLIPFDGIYAVQVEIENETFGGMMYIGNRPTVHGIRRNLEVNIFDFNRDLYGSYLTVRFIAHLRNDATFPDLEALALQLEKDRQDALRVLNATRL